MNQEERRQKRQDEFKHAAVVVTVFVLVLAVMIMGRQLPCISFCQRAQRK